MESVADIIHKIIIEIRQLDDVENLVESLSRMEHEVQFLELPEDRVIRLHKVGSMINKFVKSSCVDLRAREWSRVANIYQNAVLGISNRTVPQ